MDNINAQFIDSTPSFLQSFFAKILDFLEFIRNQGVYKAHQLVDYIFLNKTVFYIIFFVILFLLIRYLWNKFA